MQKDQMQNKIILLEKIKKCMEDPESIFWGDFWEDLFLLEQLKKGGEKFEEFVL